MAQPRGTVRRQFPGGDLITPVDVGLREYIAPAAVGPLVDECPYAIAEGFAEHLAAGADRAHVGNTAMLDYLWQPGFV